MVTVGDATGIKAEKLYEKIATTPEALDELYTDIFSDVTKAERFQMTKLFQWQRRHKAVEQSTTQGKDIVQRRSHFVHVNATNNDGETPLDIAIDLTINAGEVILKLIEAGADPQVAGEQTALVFYAILSRNKKLLLKLFEKSFNLDGAIYFSLRELSSKDDEDILQGNSIGNDDDDDDEGEDEAIFLAARRGQATIVNILLLHGSSAISSNKQYQFPLLVAVENGHAETVRVLLRDTPSTVEMENAFGLKALDVALDACHFDLALFLLREGGLGAISKLSLFTAIKQSQLEIVRLIL
ncbi:hypothetical protein G7Z17_g11895 [Cylindrodendrum hubeiense]|uniref:Ankyrin repeat protein n=1 Tax=Cylindrodendrum hubeiense TaxID=595255 RepID=A0A9P5H1Y9_9HYPO|nr:hypothetical protein G7Z17_g11895 [Cylindrodendrum hubeiense]